MKKRVLAILLATSLVAGTGWGNGCVYAAAEIPDQEAGQAALENLKTPDQQKETLEVSEQQNVSDEEVENNNKEKAEEEQAESNSEKNVKKEQAENNSKENVQTGTSVEEDTKEETQESGKDSTENEAQVEVVTEEVERNGSSNAVRINPNSVKKDALSESCDEKNYYFTINSAGVISLSFGKGYDSDPDHGWDVTLYDSSQKELMSREYSCNNTETETTCKVGVPAGTYYIKVKRKEHTDQSDAVYSLKVNYSASNVWESEFNDEVSIADPITVNQTYYGGIMEYSDVDYYRFRTNSAGVISLSFGKGYDSDPDHGWNVTLYNSSTKELMSREYSCNNTETETTCKIGVPAGTYYIKVKRKNYTDQSDAAYSLKVNYSASSVWESEFNDEAGTADPITVNQTYYGGIMEYSDVDYYRFRTNSAGVISLSFGKGYDSDSDHGWNVTLYDSSQKELMSREYSCNNAETETTCKIGIPSGTYYIKVRRKNYTDQSDAVYSLKVNYSANSTWESEFNNEIGKADPIAVGTWYSGIIMEEDDIDYYRFTVPQTSYVNISAKGEYDSDTDHRWRFFIYNASMVEQQQNIYYCGKTKTENYEAVRLPAGTYYLKVNCYNGNRSDKAYSFKINTTFTKTNTKLSTANTGSGIKLSWNRVSEGSGYKVYRKTGNGSYSLIKTIENNKTTSFTDKSVKKKNGTKYTYMVRAYKGSGQNACSGKVIYRLTAPAKPEVKNSKGKKITVKWKKNTSASGYQVKFVNGSKSRTKTFSGQKSVKKTVSGFQKGKTYKVYVRSYKKVSNKKYYSAWSAARSVKVKK